MHKHHVELTGSLTVLSPLHLGNGQRTPHDDLTRVEQGKAEPVPVLLSEIQRDGAGFPYLPGASLKGALRARLADDLAKKELFGRVNDNDHEGGDMGRLWIYGAIHQITGPAAGPKHSVAAARTRIDRASGTADDHKLFHMDMVPPGTIFAFHARWLTNETGAALDDELRKVATALAPLTDADGVALGRGGRQGQGRVHLTEVKATLVPWDGEPEAITLPAVSWQPPGERRRLRLRLTGDGPYMILDSARRPAKTDGAAEDANVLHPLLDGAGHPALPGSSLLGALRARAAWLDGGADDRDRVHTPQEALTATEQLFGVTGWRGLLGVDSIRVVDPGVKQTFTSVKLDRFSAAPIDGGLFAVEAFVDPVFEATLSLTPRGDGIPQGASDLLNRLLQDVQDMGLTLGHGAARGFGWFGVTLADHPTAAVQRSNPPAPTPQTIVYTSIPAPEPSENTSNPPRSAPYRFVPLNQTVVASDVPVIEQCPDKGLATSKSPLFARADNRRSGRITVDWTAETPFLFGQPGAQTYRADKPGAPTETILEPVRLGDRYAIPGASLRGALRSLVEIIGFSRLRGDTINGRHRFALRDFKHPEFKPLLTPGTVKAGWLRRVGEAWQLEEVNWWQVSIESVLKHLEPADDEWADEPTEAARIPSDEAWRGFGVDQKYTHFPETLRKVKFAPVTTTERNAQGRSFRKTVAQLLPSGQLGGVLVFSGPETEQRKRNEYVLEDYRKKIRTIALTPPEIEAFQAAHCKPEGGKNWEPVGSWAYWEPQFRDGKRVPVFFIADDKAQDIAGATPPDRVRKPLRIGLTRLFKLPHRYDVADVLRRTEAHRDRPTDADGVKLDIAEALFGFVDEEVDGVAGRGFKSRVLVGFARSAQPAAAIRPDQARRVTLLAPRPSFSPYYLTWADGYARRDAPMDWSHSDTRLNGRKRYPARNVAVESLDCFNETKGEKTSVESVLRFLPAGVRFTGDILYRNLTPVELGALLWAVSFGHPGGAFRHTLGHARSLGYGQFKADIVKAEGVDVPACLKHFETHMAAALGKPFADCDEIRALLRMADPRLGESRNQSPQPMLKIPGGPKTYQALRADSVKSGRNILDPYTTVARAAQPSRDPVENRQPHDKKGKNRR